MRYTVRAHTESYDTNSLDDAKSVMESMVITFRYASIIDNNNGEIVDTLEL
jgi:hypothetical protein